MSMVNPEMMQSLMNNPEIQKMMKDPNLMNKFNDILGENKPVDETLSNLNPELVNELDNHVNCCPDIKGDTSKCCPDIKGDTSKCCPDDIIHVKYPNGTKIITCNLKNDTYNNKNGTVKDKLENGRYVILFDDDIIASIKEYNLKDRYENLKNIE